MQKLKFLDQDSVAFGAILGRRRPEGRVRVRPPACCAENPDSSLIRCFGPGPCYEPEPELESEPGCGREGPRAPKRTLHAGLHNLTACLARDVSAAESDGNKPHF